MDLQKMKACPLANYRNSKHRLITDIQRINTSLQVRRDAQSLCRSDLSHRPRDVVTMSCASQHEHNVVASRGKDTDNTRSCPLNTPCTTCKDLLSYNTCPHFLFSYTPCHMASIYWGCKSQK